MSNASSLPVVNDSKVHVSDSTSSDIHARMLLTALQGVVVAVLKTVLPKAAKLSEDVVLDAEAENLLFALQKYISCIVRDQSQPKIPEKTTRIVDLQDIPLTGFPDSATDISTETQPSTEVVKSHDLTSAPSPHPEGERRFPIGKTEKSLADLRRKVFNEMPIRLLCFEKHRSTLNITLLDRPQIYAFLAQKLLANTNASNLSQQVSLITQYAILSHTWLRSEPGEVTYDDWRKGTFDLMNPGYDKLVNFCGVALEDHDLTLGWMDTVCIDKSSSSELDESIRSMYRWYQNATVCITYLAETASVSEMDSDPWFTRGWTLQELLAPWALKFYGRDWKRLVEESSSTDKMDSKIQQKIQWATTITKSELMSPSCASISRKMEWAAKRQVTRGEDSAYSLMGIFDINMSTAYGEGAELAFIRLVKEILSSSRSDLLDLFNWGGWASKSRPSFLIPTCPQLYLQRREIKYPLTLVEPLTLTHLGLRVPVLILPATRATAATADWMPIGIFHATVSLTLNITDWPVDFYNVLDAQAFHPILHNSTRYAFAVLNCGGDETTIILPENCFAVAFHYSGDVLLSPLTEKEMISTTHPITFTLQNKAKKSNIAEGHYPIKRGDLKRHMMQFLTMYF